MGKFINRYNNYNCIKRNDTEDIIKLSHYTSNIDALVNICSGEFWATDIQDFGDKNEGKLILHRINEIVTNLNQFTEEQRGKVQTLIGSFDAIKKFINDHRTSVLSMCLNINSEYMWKNYARENGYNIIFDKKLFVDTLHFYTAKGEKKEGNYIKHAKIIYSVDEQVRIIKKEITDMLSANEFGFDANSKIEYILNHLMYVGNFYKKQMLGIRNNKALGNPAMQTEDERQYKNRIDGKEVYRDPDTCTLRVKELKDGSTKDSVLINGPVGEIIAMRERIFYIDMEDHNVLKSVTYDGRKRKTWMKDPVKQFAVIGEYVICCTEDEKLIRCDMSTGKRKELADHIQYFFAGAKLYAQKGSKIVSVSYDGKGIRVFKKDVVMMDKKEDKVYYRRMDRKKEQMYVCDVDGGMEKMVGSRD